MPRHKEEYVNIEAYLENPVSVTRTSHNGQMLNIEPTNADNLSITHNSAITLDDPKVGSQAGFDENPFQKQKSRVKSASRNTGGQYRTIQALKNDKDGLMQV